MRTKPELKVTRDYSIFELHELNRPLHGRRDLFESMREHGWMPSQPMQVIRNGNGRLKVIRGHNRLDNAKRLGIPVWYVVDDSVLDIHKLEGCSGGQWTKMDFAISRAASGHKDIQAVLDFSRKHGISLGPAASLLGGESAGSANKLKDIERGTFRLAPDLSHAHAVVAITDRCRELGVEFATATAFVSAVSMLLYVPEFNPATFLHRVALNKARLEKRSTADRFLDEIEALYNYFAKNPVPLAFLAREASKRRRADFGRGKGKAA